MSDDLFGYAEDLRRLRLREAGCEPAEDVSAFCPYWKLPDGRVVAEEEAFRWLEAR